MFSVPTLSAPAEDSKVLIRCNSANDTQAESPSDSTANSSPQMGPLLAERPASQPVRTSDFSISEDQGDIPLIQRNLDVSLVHDTFAATELDGHDLWSSHSNHTLPEAPREEQPGTEDGSPPVPPPPPESPTPQRASEEAANEQYVEALLPPIPDCEVKAYIYHVGRALGRTDEQLEPLARRLVCANWLETVSHLQTLSETDWLNLNLPTQLQRQLRLYLPDAYKIVSGEKQVAKVPPKSISSVDKVVARVAATILEGSTTPTISADIHGKLLCSPTRSSAAAGSNSGSRHVHSAGPHISANHAAHQAHPNSALTPHSTSTSAPASNVFSFGHAYPGDAAQAPRIADRWTSDPLLSDHPDRNVVTIVSYPFNESPKDGYRRIHSASSYSDRAHPTDDHAEPPAASTMPARRYGDGALTCPAAPQEGSVEKFLRKTCEKYGMSQTDASLALQVLVEENWFDTLDQLTTLTPARWNMLPLPPELTRVIRLALAQETMKGDDTLERVVVRACSAMGRSGTQVEATVNRLKSSGYSSAEALRHVVDSEWVALHLPLRLLEEIRDLLSEDLSLCGVATPTTEPEAYALLPKSQRDGMLFDRVDTCCAPDERIVSTAEERATKKMTVEKFLAKVGWSVGKSDEEVAPIIERVVHENWFDSIDALRLLSPKEWEDLGLPKRFVEALRSGLSDPYVLELNRVQFTTPEPDLFPCDVISAVWKLEAEVPPEALPDTLRSLLKLMETILCNPFDESKRMIKKSNPNFQKRAGIYKAAVLLLLAVGYESSGDRFLLPVAYIARITEAHAALAQLAKLHRERLGKSKKAKLFSSIRPQ